LRRYSVGEIVASVEDAPAGGRVLMIRGEEYFRSPHQFSLFFFES
jgi:hypothetical protein